MLVIGAGDPRHLIRTLASRSDTEAEGVNKMEFYLWEQSAHVYCRQVINVLDFSLIVIVYFGDVAYAFVE